MLFWNNDYSPGLEDHMRPVRSADMPASAECCAVVCVFNPMDWWSRDCKTQSGTVHRKDTGLAMRIDWNENYFASIYIVRQVTNPVFCRAVSAELPGCFDVLKSRARHKVACRHTCGSRCTRDCKHRTPLWFTENFRPPMWILSIAISNHRSKCSSMIYGKTNVQSIIAMKADRSSAMVSLNTLQTTVSLNIYKNSAKKFGRKTGFKIENEFEDHDQSIPKLTGILTELRCIFGQNLEILTSTGGKWSCGQTQNSVNFDFQVKFDLQGQGQSTPKTIGILTKMFACLVQIWWF